MLLYLRLTVALILLLLPLVPSTALAKDEGYTVCTATINSSDERESFKRNLKNQNFKFVELTDFGGLDSKAQRGSDWFRKACESGVKCDVLVISGHYAGSFFGETGLTLETDMLEEYSCQNSCPGILSQPKEVFLFGCNTLATNDKDPRSPAEYRNELLKSGHSKEVATRITQTKYGALGTSYRDRMQRIFSGVPHIYGFDATAPLGPTIRPYLDRYFKKVPDYNNHLLKGDTEKLVSLLEQSHSKVQSINNAALENSLDEFNFSECSGVSKNDPGYDLKKEICRLHDTQTTNADKIAAIGSMLKSENRLLFQPSISGFLKDNHHGFLSSPDAQKALREIASDPKVSSELDALFDASKDSPATQIDVLHLKWMLGLLSKEDFDAKADQILRSRIKNLDQETSELVCSLKAKGIFELSVKYEDFSPSQLRSSVGAASLGCMKTADQRITREALRAFQRPSPRHHASMLWSLAALPGYDKEVKAVAESTRFSKNYAVAVMSRRALFFRGNIEDKRTHLRGMLDSASGAWTAAEMVKDTGFKDDTAARDVIRELRFGSDEAKPALAEILTNIADSEGTIWREVRRDLGVRSEAANKEIAARLAIKNSNNQHVTSWAYDNVMKGANAGVYKPFMSVLAHSKLDAYQASEMVDFIRAKPDDPKTPYLRWVLQSQKDLNLTSAQMYQLKGPIKKFDCRTFDNKRYWCGEL